MKNPNAWKTVDKCAKCNRCGATDVAWVLSKRGKWYLAPVYKDGDYLVANVMQFHKCPEPAPKA
jgi:hypothetical protein